MKKIITAIILCFSMVVNCMSAITLVDFDGFESGGDEGLTVSNGTVQAEGEGGAPAPWSSKESYVLRQSNLSSASRSKVATPGTDWNSNAFYVHWDNFQRSGDTFTFFQTKSGATHFTLKVVTESATKAGIRLDDANGSQIGTTQTGLLFANQWSLIEIKWKKSNTGDLTLWFNHSIIFEVTGEDLDSGNASVEMSFLNLSNQTFSINMFIDSYYYQTDDGANINTNRTLYGKYTILGAWKTNQPGTVPDFGNTLDGGSWPSTEQVPQNTTNTAHYSTAAGGRNESGGISKDKTTTGGPKNDVDVDGTIRGGKWIWVWKGPAWSMFGTVVKWKGKYGANTAPTTDNTSSTSFLQGNGSWKNLFVISNTMSGTGRVPQTGDHAQIGFGIQASELSGTASIADMWVFILHEEKRSVLTDGHIMKVD